MNGARGIVSRAGMSSRWRRCSRSRRGGMASTSGPIAATCPTISQASRRGPEVRSPTARSTLRSTSSCPSNECERHCGPVIWTHPPNDGNFVSRGTIERPCLMRITMSLERAKSSRGLPPSTRNSPRYLRGHSGISRASSRHSDGKLRRRESGADTGHRFARLLRRSACPG
jgi:hypothetical protein